MLPHSPAPITAWGYFIFGRNYSETTKREKIIHMCSLNSSGWLKSHLILKSIEVCLGAWVRGIIRVIDHFWTLEGWMGGRAGINHLISRESTMDIGVGWGGWGGDQQPNSGGESREEENAEKKDFGKSWKEFPCTSKSNSVPNFNQGKGQSHYKTPQIEQKEKEWLCLKFWPFEPSIYVKEIYSKLQKDFHRTNEKWCWEWCSGNWYFFL